MTSQLRNLPETLSNNPDTGNNGSTSPLSTREKRQVRRRSRLWVTVGVLCILVTGVGAAWLLIPGEDQFQNLIWTAAKKQDIQLTITERGEVESVNNVDIVCDVEVGRSSRGPTIRWLIDPGTRVKKGEVLLLLEDSAFQKELLDQEIVLKRAENEYEQARDNLEIVESENEAALEVARLNVDQAIITLEKYEKGVSSQMIKEITGRRLLAKADVERWEQRVAFAELMVRRGSYSQAQLESEQDSLRSAQVTLAGVEEEYRVQSKYEDKLQRVVLASAVAQAKSQQAAARRKAKATESQAVNDRDTKFAVYRQEKAKYDEIRTEVEACTMRAPQDGLVVYYESPQSRRSAESPKIEVGASVHEGQKLLQIPDLSRMQVQTRVHEALVSHVRGEEYRKTGFSEALQASMLLNPSTGGRLFGLMSCSTLKQDPDANWFRELDQVRTYNGQRALIRADAFSSKMLKGRVRSVKNVATKQWFSDVRTYETIVEVEDTNVPLKPGMSARVTIFTDRRAENVLSVPVQALFRETNNKETHHYVFVKGPKGPIKRKVEVGIHNDQLVEIKSGLKAGDLVAENPTALQKDAEGNPLATSKGGQKGKGPGGRPGGGRPRK